jgi:sarcosine oxidase subunit gamma
MFRRSRLAQVPAAFWMPDAETFQIVCFRSVARYMFDLLSIAAQPGSEVGHF